MWLQKLMNSQAHKPVDALIWRNSAVRWAHQLLQSHRPTVFWRSYQCTVCRRGVRLRPHCYGAYPDGVLCLRQIPIGSPPNGRGSLRDVWTFIATLGCSDPSVKSGWANNAGSVVAHKSRQGAHVLWCSSFVGLNWEPVKRTQWVFLPHRCSGTAQPLLQHPRRPCLAHKGDLGMETPVRWLTSINALFKDSKASWASSVHSNLALFFVSRVSGSAIEAKFLTNLR